MKGNSKKAIEFLQDFKPRSLWVLVAIDPNKKGLEVKTFQPDQAGMAEVWIDKRNGTHNLYFHVNNVIGELDKKASRENIKAMTHLHVDVDPNAGEDVDEERDRILELFIDKLPKGIPPPSYLIDSGGGYQGFWALEEPVPIDGKLEAAEDAKLYNIKIEQDFNADNCHNIDRIMRLPGTINIPDAKKKAKGRVAREAVLINSTGKKYKIEDFKKAIKVQTQEGLLADASTTKVNISGNVALIGNIDELDQWDVPERLKVIAVQGRDPDKPKMGDDSRSAWLMDFCCGLAKCKVPDEIIYSIITDAAYGISESVVELKSNMERYATRQIQRAKEFAVDPNLAKMNARFAVVANYGGKCRVMSDDYDEVAERTVLSLQSFSDFNNRFMHQTIPVKNARNEITYIPISKWWLKHPDRRQYEKIVFSPDKEVPDCYNLWKGFAVEPVAGDCDPFLNYVKHVVCSGNVVYYDYLIGWCANMMQNLSKPGYTSVVLRGEEGIGKSFLAHQIGKLLGRHYIAIRDTKHLVGSFNAHLRDVILLFADEAFYAGDKKHEGVLKGLITEEVLAIEAKGVDVETAPSRLHVIMASNSDWVVPAGPTARRFFVLEVLKQEFADKKFFKELAEFMENGGSHALLHYLLNYDLTDFDVRNVPKTKALYDQKELSLKPREKWFREILERGHVLNHGSAWKGIVPKETLFDEYSLWAKQWPDWERENQVTLGRFLSQYIDKTIQKTIDMPMEDGRTGEMKLVPKRVRCYVFHDLKTCRHIWEEGFSAGSSIKWSEPEYEEEEELPAVF